MKWYRTSAGRLRGAEGKTRSLLLAFLAAFAISCGGGGGGVVFSLIVQKAGSGIGTVTSNPPGINCGATCTYAFGSGTLVTLTAAPLGGSVFTIWGGDCVGVGTSAQVVMTANKTCTATFSLTGPGPFDISASEFDGGGGTSTGGSFGVSGIAGQASGAGSSTGGGFTLEGGI